MFTHGIVGGTFDRLHFGHRALLTRAFAISEHVTIGVTTDAYVRKCKNTQECDEENTSGAACLCVSFTPIQSYEMRVRELQRWLDAKGYTSRTHIVPIDDLFGPTLGGNEQFSSPDFSLAPFDVIIVSLETKKNAEKINRKRKKLALTPLAIDVVPMVFAEDDQPISATRIRAHEIDTQGKLLLPEHLRQEFALPFGMVLSDGDTESIIRGDHEALVISVGDKTTKRLVDNGIVPTLAIIDMQVERQPYIWEKDDWDKLPKNRMELSSGPGYISSSVIDVIKSWKEERRPLLLVIDGEEDLLTLPALVYAPLDTVVYYGQPASPVSFPDGKRVGGPGVGLVRVVVTEKVRARATKLLTQFTQEIVPSS